MPPPGKWQTRPRKPRKLTAPAHHRQTRAIRPPPPQAASPAQAEAKAAVDRADAYLTEGAVKTRQGDPEGGAAAVDRALAAVDQAIKLDPNNAEAYHLRGFVKYNKADLTGAKADWSRAIELDPDNAGAYNMRGEIKHRQGDPEGGDADYARALAISDQAIKLDPNNAEAYLNRGAAKWNLGDPEGGQADIARGRELAPLDDRIAAYDIAAEAERMAINEINGGVFNGPSWADFDRAIELDPDNVEIHLKRGFAMFYRAGNRTEPGANSQRVADYDEVVAYYDRVIESFPAENGAYGGRAAAHKGRAGARFFYPYEGGDKRGYKRDMEQAIADFDRAIELAPDSSREHLMTRRKETIADYKETLADAESQAAYRAKRKRQNRETLKTVMDGLNNPETPPELRKHLETAREILEASE